MWRDPCLAVGLALVSILVLDVTKFIWGTATQPVPAGLVSAFALFLQGWKTAGASWIALALVLSFASVKLFTRFVPG